MFLSYGDRKDPPPPKINFGAKRSAATKTPVAKRVAHLKKTCCEKVATRLRRVLRILIYASFPGFEQRNT